ncbi:MetQ/NlpA family lipoprotein [soil metagenome]
MNNYIKNFSLLSLSALALLGCKPEQSANTIQVGIIGGPQTKIMETAKQVALKNYGLNIKVVEFSDYIMPNTALNDGNLDANIFQHQPYLNAAIKAKSYALTAIAKTFVYPMGVYSNKITHLDKLPNKAVVAIPNDPSNEARALIMLNKMGLITLKAGKGTDATTLDIVSNPKNLQIKELDAAQIPRVLADVTLAVINDDYAIPAGLSNDNALYVEEKDSPYANIIVARTADRDNPKLKQLIAAMHSAEVIQTTKEITKGQAIQAW